MVENNFNLLYTNGCSMTNHTPIPVENSWTAYLAELLGINYINDAYGAGSNARIIRTMIDFLEKGDYDPEKTLVIIQLTSPFRYELLYTKTTIDTFDVHSLTEEDLEDAAGRDYDAGWHRYYDMQFMNDDNTGFLSFNEFYKNRNAGIREKDAYDYWIAKKKIYGDVRRHYDMITQANALSNLLNSYGVENHYFVNHHCGYYKDTQHLGGWQTVNWLDKTPWDSDIFNYYDDSVRISATDPHPNPEGNKLIANKIYSHLQDSFAKTS